MGRPVAPDLLGALQEARGVTYRLDGVDYTVWDMPRVEILPDGSEALWFTLKAVRASDGAVLISTLKPQYIINPPTPPATGGANAKREFARALLARLV